MSLRDPSQKLQGLPIEGSALATLAPEAADAINRRRSKAMDSVAMPARLRCSEAAAAAGMSETLARYAKDYPAGPHDQPQSMCPAFGSLARRLAHAAHRERAVRFGLLRLRTDIHFAFLWRAAHGGLRSLQFGDARHRKVIRGHSRGGLQVSPIPTNTTRSSSSIFACRPLQACRCGCCRRRSMAFASSASTCRVSACRRTLKPRTYSPGAMLNFARQEAEQGPVQAPRGPRVRKSRP